MQAATEKVQRPSGTMVIFSTGLQKGLPQEWGAHWWEVTYRDGHKAYFQVPPPTAQNIHYVRYCINDYERATTDLGAGGTLIKISPLETVTYVYPSFWTGQEWVLEADLPHKAPVVFKRLQAKATLEHRAIIGVRHWRELEYAIIRNQARIAGLFAELKQPGLSGERRTYLNRQVKHYQTLLAHDQELRKTPFKNTASPPTLVRGYRFAEELQKVTQECDKLEKTIAWLQGEIPQKQGLEQKKLSIELKQRRAELAIMRQTIPKLQALQAEYQRKNWILDY